MNVKLQDQETLT